MMKSGAGYLGIMLGLFSLVYLGIFGGVVGSAAGWLGSLAPQLSVSGEITQWAGMVTLISWLAPLLALSGGAITFSNGRLGGALLAGSAGLHWYLLGIGTLAACRTYSATLKSW